MIEAQTAADALPILRSEAPIAILLTDIQLGGDQDGLQLARIAREARPDLPIIYMTGRPRSEEPGRHSHARKLHREALPSVGIGGSGATHDCRRLTPVSAVAARRAGAMHGEA